VEWPERVRDCLPDELVEALAAGMRNELVALRFVPGGVVPVVVLVAGVVNSDRDRLEHGARLALVCRLAQ
jgi:hypothetical protein